MLLIATGCSLEEYKPVVMFKETQSEPKTFPATVEIDYFVHNGSNLQNNKTLVSFEWEEAGKISRYHVYPVEKTTDGYIVHGSKYEGYTIKNPKKLNLSPIILLDSSNGTISMTFENIKQYKDFFDLISGWEEVCEYYNCSDPNETGKEEASK